MIVIAHRGARAFAPENTLEAFAKAGETRADAVELDVQLSADGVPVVCHDDTLLRCSDAAERFPGRAPWATSSFTLAELGQLDAGSWFEAELGLPPERRQAFLQTLEEAEAAQWISAGDRAAFASGRVRIPTLAESLACCDDLGLRVHVELKSIPRLWDDLADRALAAIDRLGMRGRVVVSSFDHQQLARMRALAPDVELAVLTSDRLYRPAEYLARLGASTYNAGCLAPFDTLGFGSASGALDTRTIAELRAAGFGVAAWTENDPGRMRALVDAGVSAIFTDYPNRLRGILG
ncbi:MAG: glycerophosphodiester phosphodiesterase [Gammaproteobacteria bacterium]|nr:glycerophosphodiester phosphodiesterase [Gammaproteobacteria bacterium]